MSHAAERGMGCKTFQVPLCTCAISKRHPSHHAADQRMLFGQREQPGGLLHSLARLHRYCSLDTEMVHQLFQLVRQEIPPDDAHLRSYPSVLSGSVFPEMVMGVDHHRGMLDSH